jgi:GT2 family glycosyltransferase
LLTSVWCVIVNWNLWPDTIRCIESLLAAGLPLEHALVVDNGSEDDSVARLQAHFGQGLSLVTSPQNLGFGGGCNLGIETTLAQGAKWVLLLNNDTYVAPTFFTELAQAMALGPQHAILAPLILYADQPTHVWRLGDRRVLGTFITHSLFRDAPEPEAPAPLYPVDFVTGCAMLVRADVFRTIGFFNQDTFMYAEDVDFCWRAHLQGFSLAAAPRARMWHKVSSSSNRDRPAARYWRIQNQLRFYREYAWGWQVVPLFVFSALRVLWLMAGDLASGHLGLIRPLTRGWLDGWFGARGAVKNL